jgi:hypothetical protein
MLDLKIIVDKDNEQVTTFGLYSEVRGSIDGTVGFSEVGITSEMDNEEVEEFLIERHSDYNVIVEVS